MLSSLSETLSFVQNLQESLTQDEINMCEVRQSWRSALDTLEAHREAAEGQLNAIVEGLSRSYVNKVVEVSLYKQAIVSKGNDAQRLLKASIDDMMNLKTENARLKDFADTKTFQQRYCTTQVQSVDTDYKNSNAPSFGLGSFDNRCSGCS